MTTLFKNGKPTYHCNQCGKDGFPSLKYRIIAVRPTQFEGAWYGKDFCFFGTCPDCSHPEVWDLTMEA